MKWYFLFVLFALSGCVIDSEEKRFASGFIKIPYKNAPDISMVFIRNGFDEMYLINHSGDFVYRKFRKDNSEVYRVDCVVDSVDYVEVLNESIKYASYEFNQNSVVVYSNTSGEFRLTFSDNNAYVSMSSFFDINAGGVSSLENQGRYLIKKCNEQKSIRDKAE